jgi:integrase
MSSQRRKLTKASVQSIQPVAGKQILVWDTELRGFGLRVSPGGAKAFIMQRRIGTTERRVTIGRADDVPPEIARKKAMGMAAQFADGKDPVKEKKERKVRTLTLRSAFEAYIAAPKKRGLGKGGAKRTSTVLDIRKAMQSFVEWLDTPLAEITGAMVRDRHAEMAQRSAAQANLAHRYLRAAINHVLADADEHETPIVRFNPVNRLNRLNAWRPIKPRERRIPRDKIGVWVRAVRSELVGLRYESELRDALMFALLTGARREEIVGCRKTGHPPLRWAEVDFTRRTVLFRDTKNGRDHVLPIGSGLVSMLEARRSKSGPDFVFSDGSGHVPEDLRSAFKRVAKVTGVAFSLHDLRRTFVSVAEIGLRIPQSLVMRLTNHTTPTAGAHSGYVIFDETELRRAMQQIEDFLLSPTRQYDDHHVIEFAEGQ